MSMTLSREVPFKIRDHLPGFMHELSEVSGVTKEELIKDAIFAVHPGGPLIVEAVQKKLELNLDQVKFSHEVLRTRGNMSSATLPHVWKAIWESKPPHGKKIVSLAFGPGLTIFGSVFEVKT
jgi:predicted naringenin-chalcone synthase